MTPRRTWGDALLQLPRRRLHWIDLLLLVGLAGLILGGIDIVREVRQPPRSHVEIDLDSAFALVRYTFYSLFRGLIAYGLSIAFTLTVGYWAAKDPAAERVLVPLLDVLQSIPVLSFLPGLVLALIALFPQNIGLEIAAILMIFTGQVWNMTFSYMHSLKAVPPDLREVAAIFRFNWWQKLRWLELPYATMGLVWNSMMSMAGGWFFLTVCESFRLGEDDYRLPGLGSYVSAAVDQGRLDAMVWAWVAMVAMIVLLDQFLWRPVVVWAQKFRLEEGAGGPQMTSWFLRWLRRSRLIAYATRWIRRRRGEATEAKVTTLELPDRQSTKSGAIISYVSLAVLLILLVWGAWRIALLLREVSLSTWKDIFLSAGATFLRVAGSTALGTLWAVPAGLAIGLSPRLSRLLQPVIQVAASFPAPMLFPIVIAVLTFFGIGIDFGSLVLMLMGTQWYILFNVVAGAMAIPADLREAARSFSVRGRLRLWTVYLPAIFPYLVTGWVTAAGGAWNASIVAEYVSFRGETLVAFGLGSRISQATEAGDFSALAASTMVMALLVVSFNRSVWRRLYQLAQTRFSLSK
jgi:NitT/TauT family transport system permease protein